MKTRIARTIVYTFLFIFIVTPIDAIGQQDYFYSYDGQQIPLNIAADRFVLQSVELLVAQQVSDRLRLQIPLADVRPLPGANTQGFFEVVLEKAYTDVSHLLTKIESLRAAAEWGTVQPIYLMNDQPVIPYDVFNVKIQDESALSELLELNNRYDVEVLRRSELVPAIFTLRMSEHSEHTVAEIARIYYERLNLYWSQPDFVQNIRRHGIVSDPYYAYQFYMHIIDAERAWDITSGSNNIVVAVIDDGVMAHEDLAASRLVNGYDAVGFSGGAPEGNEAHGMAAAGIIAAAHNTLGIAGLAPTVDVMPVRIFNQHGIAGSDTEVAQAFEHAVLNGADVINNSWGYETTDTTRNASLNAFIREAINTGRNGKGTIVVWAAGNRGGAVEYPANYPGVIAVGATTENDEIFDYSARGAEIGLVAPSGEIPEQIGWGPCDSNPRIELHGNIWSLDHDAPTGFNPGNTGLHWPECYTEWIWSTHSGQPTPGQGYTAHFGGTSASAPQVSGVAALILAVDPSLELDDVEGILQSTADWKSHMGTSPPSHEYGYGRLNARRAVRAALPQRIGGVFGNETLGYTRFVQYNVHEMATATVPAGIGVMISDFYDGWGSSWSKFEVYGNLVIDNNADVLSIHIDVKDGGRLIVNNGTLRNVSIEVENGGQLIARPNALFRFGSGQGIVSYGKVHVEGGPFTPVRFERTGSSSWAGIQLIGSGAAGSVLRNVEIEGASTQNIYAHNTSWITLENVESYNSTNGAWFSSSTANTIARSVFRDNTRGVYISGSQMTFPPNEFMLEFRDNSQDGVFISGPGSTQFGAWCEKTNFLVQNNSQNGVRVEGTAFVWIGMEESQHTGGLTGTDEVWNTGGYGEIRDNTQYNLHMSDFAEVDAELIYWGSSSPKLSKFYDDGTVLLSYDPWFMDSPFTPGFNEPCTPWSMQLAGGSSVNAPSVQSGSDEMYWRSLSPARFAAEIHRLRKEEGHESSRQTLYAILAQEDSPHENLARVLLMQDQLYLGEASQALETGARVLADDGVRDHKKRFTASVLFAAHLFDLRDPAGARGMLSVLSDLGHEDYLNGTFAAMIDGFGPPDEEQDATTGELAATNYPNPFNPVTRISFTLVQDSHVRLAVYDMLGRRVTLLVDEFHAAGTHNVTFDGSNLPSGVYFYRLYGTGTMMTRTMTLVK